MPQPVGKTGEIFTPMFSEDKHLDVLFLSESEENELREICAAFYYSPS
jgi:hypothetical protein